LLSKFTNVKVSGAAVNQLLGQVPRPAGNSVSLPLISLTDANKADLGYATGNISPQELVLKLSEALKKFSPPLPEEKVKQIEKDMADATAAVEAGRYGQALQKLRPITKLGGTYTQTEQARKKEAEILEQGRSFLAEAKEKIKADDVGAGTMALAKIALAFGDAEPAKDARKLLQRFQEDPKAAEAIKLLSDQREAEDAFKEGKVLELEKKPEAALKVYKKIISRYPNSDCASKAQERIDALGKDAPAPTETEKPKPTADPKAKLRSLMNMARNFAANGKNADAIAYYKKAIALAPDSEEAAQAKAEIEKLGGN
jgi:tetratricopeptide (TPR) repeat protein